MSDLGTGTDQPPATPNPSTTATRSKATYALAALIVVVLALVVVFVLQNLHRADVHFLTMRFHAALGLLVLASAVAGGIVVALANLARAVHGRLAARRRRR